MNEGIENSKYKTMW